MWKNLGDSIRQTMITNNNNTCCILNEKKVLPIMIYHLIKLKAYGRSFPQRRGTILLFLVHCGPQSCLTEGVGGLLNLSKFFIHAIAIKICNNINCKKPGRSIFSSVLFLLCKLPSCTCGIKIRSFECILVTTKASEGIKVAARNLLTFIRWYIIICNALFSFLIHAFTYYCCVSRISGPNIM